MKLLNCGFLGLLILLSVSCRPDSKPKNETSNRELILIAAREIIKASGKCALISLDENGRPQVRTMDPFEPESDFTIWLATNPKSRKVIQIKNNPNVTLYYSDKNMFQFMEKQN
jgi:general stress protein 26